MEKKEKLMVKLYQIGALQFGSFILKSGLKSPFYIDLRILVSYPTVLKEVALIYNEILQRLKFDRMAAVPYTAIPIVTAISILNKKPFIYTRKEQKSYGIKRPAEGRFNEEDKVVLIDDMITTGQSKLETISVLEKLGLRVKEVVVLFDREQGGGEDLEKAGYYLLAAFTISQWLEVLFKKKKISQKIYNDVFSYLKK